MEKRRKASHRRGTHEESAPSLAAAAHEPKLLRPASNSRCGDCKKHPQTLTVRYAKLSPGLRTTCPTRSLWLLGAAYRKSSPWPALFGIFEVRCERAVASRALQAAAEVFQSLQYLQATIKACEDFATPVDQSRDETESYMKLLHPERRVNSKQRNGTRDRSLLLRLELPSDPSLLCAVRGAVERLTESFGFSPPDCRAVTRAVDEALTNIIRHAYNGRPDRPIEMFFRSVHRPPDSHAAEGLEIVLCDRGPSIKQAQLCMRALEEVRPGGLGLHFIQQSMDIVEYKRANGTNRLRLVKYVRAPKQEVKS